MPIIRPPPAVALADPPAPSPVYTELAGAAAGILAAVEEGTREALRGAVAAIGAEGLGGTEAGQVMTAVSRLLLRRVYGEAAAGASPVLPAGHPYARIIADAEMGIYRPAPALSTDYLERVLPSLSLLPSASAADQSVSPGQSDAGQSDAAPSVRTPPSVLAQAEADLLSAVQLNANGVLARYFLGLVCEASGRTEEALARYEEARKKGCVPAAIGASRVLLRLGRAAGSDLTAASVLAEAAEREPDNRAVTRQLAIAYLAEGNGEAAEAVIARALEAAPDDPALVLLLARVRLEAGGYEAAQLLLDNLPGAHRRDYLFLRARLQNEGFSNAANAALILAGLLEAYPGDLEIRLYMTRLLLESPDPDENAEGRARLAEMMRPYTDAGVADADASGTGVPYSSVPADILLLAYDDAVRRADWEAARLMEGRVLAERRSAAALLNAVKTAAGLGETREALALAEELADAYPGYEEGHIAHAEALIAAGRRVEARRLINARLALSASGTLVSGAVKSRYYYLRAAAGGGGEAALSDLRTSLFENPRNLDTLIALFEAYRRAGDERRAVYYLRQALAIAPSDPRLLQYEALAN